MYLLPLQDSKPNGNTVGRNTVAFLPLVDSNKAVQHLNNEGFQRTTNLLKRSAIPQQSIDQELNKRYFCNRYRTRPPHADQIQERQFNRPNTSWFRYIIQHNSPDWIKHLDLVTRVTASQCLRRSYQT